MVRYSRVSWRCELVEIGVSEDKYNRGCDLVVIRVSRYKGYWESDGISVIPSFYLDPVL